MLDGVGKILECSYII